MPYAIVATLGPSSAEPRLWAGMQAAGASAYRLNTSHLTPPALAVWLQRLAAHFKTQGGAIPVILDLQGSKWRLGQFEPRILRVGEPVILSLADSSARADTLPVPHADFFRAAQSGDGEVVLNDAKSRLRIATATQDEVRAVVTQGGEIRARKGITLSGSGARVETINTADQAMLDVARPYPFVEYAVSYVRDGLEMERYRRWFPAGARLVAKLERRPALDDAAAIARHADALWLCRGDLGAELGIPHMAAAVHRCTASLREYPVPLLMAGQVLEHMVESPTPTRSEVCFLYDCLQAGYAGVVLSDECAVGRHPVESVRAAAMFHAGA
jgi:pyruvate kinase